MTQETIDLEKLHAAIKEQHLEGWNISDETNAMLAKAARAYLTLRQSVSDDEVKRALEEMPQKWENESFVSWNGRLINWYDNNNETIRKLLTNIIGIKDE